VFTAPIDEPAIVSIKGGVHMVRRMLALVMALTIVITGPLAALAQDGTPTINLGGGSGPQIGEAVSWVGNEGSEVAKVTVNKITDPFEDFDAASSIPTRGFHFALLSVTIENTGPRPVSVDPSAFQLVDSQGYQSRYYGVYRTEESTTAEPDLQYADLAAGESITGVIGFQILNGTTIESVIFAPDSSRLITLVGGGTAGNGGEPVSVIGFDEKEAAQITVNQVLEPYDAYDSSSAPARGSHYVGVEVTFKNTSTRTMQIDPGSIYAVDDLGFLAQRSYLYPTSTDTWVPLDYATLEPGASVSGMVFFLAFDGTTTDKVVYLTYYSNPQVITLAVKGENGFASNPASPTTPGGEATAPAGNPEACAGVVEWYTALLAEMGTVGDVFTVIGDITDDSGTIPDADTLRDYADRLDASAKNVRGLDHPEIGDAINTLVRATLGDLADGLNDLADAVEANDQAGIDSAKEDLTNALSDFFAGADAQSQLETTCPEITSVGE
jgi:hypothetical protein